MTWLRTFRRQPWLAVSATVIGLLVMIAVAGLAGLVLNLRVSTLTERTLDYDIELEDRGNELLVAVVEVRHLHRNMVLARSLSRRSIADFEGAYAELVSQIEQFDELGAQTSDLPKPGLLRDMADDYYAGFRPAIELYTSDPAAFTAASDDGLMKLDALQRSALQISRIGEQSGEAALQSLKQATRTARAVQLAILAGLVLVGGGLGYTTVRTAREQQKISQRLEHALQTKSDFIADASHELRTPLTVLRGNAEVALELDRTCVHTELLEEIVEESEHMTRLVEDLLFLARSDAGSLPLELETTAAEPFLVELSERAAILARQREVPFEAHVRSTGALEIDAGRIAQAVLILVDNAAKYGSSEAPIALTAFNSGQDVMIEVRDRGPGIPEAELLLVFERFYRVDKARARKQGGAGLGLSIAKTIIEAHGGRIEAESRLNHGTTMRICLPQSPGPWKSGRLIEQMVGKES